MPDNDPTSADVREADAQWCELYAAASIGIPEYAERLYRLAALSRGVGELERDAARWRAVRDHSLQIDVADNYDVLIYEPPSERDDPRLLADGVTHDAAIDAFIARKLVGGGA